MSKEKKFIDGFYVQRPHEKAPSFVLMRGSMQREKLLNFLQNNTEEYINFDVLEGKEGKVYAAINEFKPSSSSEKPNSSEMTGTDDLPF